MHRWQWTICICCVALILRWPTHEVLAHGIPLKILIIKQVVWQPERLFKQLLVLIGKEGCVKGCFISLNDFKAVIF